MHGISHMPQGELCFNQAIEIARSQNARSLELHAIISLGRFLKQKGARDRARKMLAETHSWLTEGLGTGDLKEAKILLVQLS